jgi:tRNA threonylcarbamoyladenosine biosynthesis protein TsaE
MPILDDSSLEFISHSSDQTRRVGMRLGALLNSGDVVHLVGELGAGKTTLVQGISSGWGSSDQVTSPSFVLVNIYRRVDGERLYHLDAYRLNNIREAQELDILNFIENGPLVVEWANNIREALPENHLLVTFDLVGNDQRDLLFTAQGEPYQELLDRFRTHVYGVP